MFAGEGWSFETYKQQTNFDLSHTEKQANYKLKNIYYNCMLDTGKKKKYYIL